MANYKEIVTKAVISKGKKLYTTNHSVTVNNPSTILGCWVINHNFHGLKSQNKIEIDGSYDVNIWYSSENDSKTDVIKETNTYHETINMRDREDTSGEEVIVRSLKQPNCIKVDIVGNEIEYVIEKEPVYSGDDDYIFFEEEPIGYKNVLKEEKQKQTEISKKNSI